MAIHSFIYGASTIRVSPGDKKSLSFTDVQEEPTLPPGPEEIRIIMKKHGADKIALGTNVDETISHNHGEDSQIYLPWSRLGIGGAAFIAYQHLDLATSSGADKISDEKVRQMIRTEIGFEPHSVAFLTKRDAGAPRSFWQMDIGGFGICEEIPISAIHLDFLCKEECFGEIGYLVQGQNSRIGYHGELDRTVEEEWACAWSQMPKARAYASLEEISLPDTVGFDNFQMENALVAFDPVLFAWEAAKAWQVSLPTDCKIKGAIDLECHNGKRINRLVKGMLFGRDLGQVALITYRDGKFDQQEGPQFLSGLERKTVKFKRFMEYMTSSKETWDRVVNKNCQGSP